MWVREGRKELDAITPSNTRVCVKGKEGKREGKGLLLEARYVRIDSLPSINNPIIICYTVLSLYSNVL